MMEFMILLHEDSSFGKQEINTISKHSESPQVKLKAQDLD